MYSTTTMLPSRQEFRLTIYRALDSYISAPSTEINRVILLFKLDHYIRRWNCARMTMESILEWLLERYPLDRNTPRKDDLYNLVLVIFETYIGDEHPIERIFEIELRKIRQYIWIKYKILTPL